jgi:putative ABC transport system permease protein
MPLQYTFVDDVVNRMLDGQRQEGMLVALFCFVSVLISCLGLFGLVTYIAESKTKEIGIRKVFGASVGDLVMMLTKEFLVLVTIAALIAFPLAFYWIELLLQDYAYRIPVGWELFAISLLITIILTLGTVGRQAFRAATANPVKAITNCD